MQDRPEMYRNWRLFAKKKCQLNYLKKEPRPQMISSYCWCLKGAKHGIKNWGMWTCFWLSLWFNKKKTMSFDNKWPQLLTRKFWVMIHILWKRQSMYVAGVCKLLSPTLYVNSPRWCRSIIYSNFSLIFSLMLDYSEIFMSPHSLYFYAAKLQKEAS